MQREILGYAQLSQAAMQSTRMIADDVAQWKGAADGSATEKNKPNRASWPAFIVIDRDAVSRSAALDAKLAR